MKAMVTGSSGFVASHLIELLGKEGIEVYRFDIKTGEDFRDYEVVRLAVDSFRPDWIFHLGALAYIPESFWSPRRAIDTNAIGSLNFLEAVRQIGLKTHIMLCGTSEEYGDTLDVEEIDEMTLPNPLSPYAIGKLAMSHLGRLYAKSYGMNVVVTRAFNHTGPGRGEMYAEGSFAKQIVEIERGMRKVLEHGDLTPIRNYTDVRDMVKAYRMAITLPSDLYNICSDQNISINNMLARLVGYSESRIETKQIPTLMRPADFSFKPPNCDKFKQLTGWEPEIPFTTTLKDILEEWRQIL